MSAQYDRIGGTYAHTRKADPRIGRLIAAALGDAKTVVNVGAGTGSYEPIDRDVTAVEPSEKMISQRPSSSASAICASAESLPFDDDSFDAAMAILTIHHWSDQEKGLKELKRVARNRVVILTFDPDARPWPTRYFPKLVELDAGAMPSIGSLTRLLGKSEVRVVPIPHDCQDGFLYAYWRRPEAYLDERVRSGSSSFWKIGDVSTGISNLSADLQTGAWHRRYSDLLDQETYDAGYRLIVVEL
ncbi:MAG: SAM-dependent methyltransferase [Sphingomonadaceae bacterium]|nr:SAM-dependent methyltransferase [Sphingomonadaceae bacterium]|tara:strand:- start:831 stop:1562 length:732 start_codon:yes stop_codon:yes gene_type:complete